MCFSLVQVLLIFSLCLSCTRDVVEVRAWGLDAHRNIARVASEQSGQLLCSRWSAALSNEQTIARLRQLVTEPDEIRLQVERPRHFNNADDPHRDRDVPIWSADYERGVVSWALYNHTMLVQEYLEPFCNSLSPTTSDETVLAFVLNHTETLLRSLAYVCHYTGDSCQPLHATRNYDGQLTGNRGIHSVFESRLVSRYEQDLFPLIALRQARVLSDPFAVTETSVYSGLEQVHLILEADDRARVVDPQRGDAYYASLFESLRPLLLARLTRSVQTTVDVWATALVRAGCCSPDELPVVDVDEIDSQGSGDSSWTASLGAVLGFAALAGSLGAVLGAGFAVMAMQARRSRNRYSSRFLDAPHFEQLIDEVVNLEEDAVELDSVELEEIHRPEAGGGRGADEDGKFR